MQTLRFVIMNKKITLGFSPCPNDTFIFDALIHHKIDTQGIDFEVAMEDVEALNQMAEAGILDVTKLSYHAFAYMTQTYQLLLSGSALGHGCGPLLIAKDKLTNEQINQAKIAIPGKLTTANLLLSVAYPKAVNRHSVLFSDIEDVVLSGEYDAGLLIHENRFTFEDKGLVSLMDLGDYWENLTWLPIPLGGIVMKREFSQETKQLVSDLIRQSVEYAFKHTEEALPYIRQYAQTMSDEVMLKHIGLYVNEYSLDLGDKGKTAVQRLLDTAVDSHLISNYHTPIWI